VVKKNINKINTLYHLTTSLPINEIHEILGAVLQYSYILLGCVLGGEVVRQPLDQIRAQRCANATSEVNSAA
jgi:hypothetical protein